MAEAYPNRSQLDTAFSAVEKARQHIEALKVALERVEANNKAAAAAAQAAASNDPNASAAAAAAAGKNEQLVRTLHAKIQSSHKDLYEAERMVEKAKEQLRQSAYVLPKNRDTRDPWMDIKVALDTWDDMLHKLGQPTPSSTTNANVNVSVTPNASIASDPGTFSIARVVRPRYMPITPLTRNDVKHIMENHGTVAHISWHSHPLIGDPHSIILIFRIDDVLQASLLLRSINQDTCLVASTHATTSAIQPRPTPADSSTQSSNHNALVKSINENFQLGVKRKRQEEVAAEEIPVEMTQAVVWPYNVSKDKLFNLQPPSAALFCLLTERANAALRHFWYTEAEGKTALLSYVKWLASHDNLFKDAGLGSARGLMFDAARAAFLPPCIRLFDLNDLKPRHPRSCLSRGEQSAQTPNMILSGGAGSAQFMQAQGENQGFAPSGK